MNDKEIQQVLDVVEERNEKLYAWLRWLLLLAASSLAVLVSLHGDKPFLGVSGVMMKFAWVLLGSGIVFGAFALYVEVWTARRILEELIRRKRDRDLAGNEAVPRAEILVTAPNVLRLCEPACYVSLLGAVVAIVAYVILQ